jgi:hypothetical protein
MLDAELHPNLLYRIDGDQARFATWRLNEGHESLALFTTRETAERYASEVESAPGWTIYEPPREKLIEILRGCREAGILYAALDPVNGSAKTLFDIPQVLMAAHGEREA